MLLKTPFKVSKRSYLLNTIWLMFYSFPLISQIYFNENIARQFVTVESENKKVYKFPWTGGMNSCQFGQIDLDLDGTKDLFVFDRHGDRIMTFVNGGAPGVVDYDYAPEYAESFPDLEDWAILIDYDQDGKEDIFSKSPGLPGIIVYKNISATSLEFELVIYPFLLSYQGGGYVNILVTDVDYPGISDIDGDGDLDILTFWGLGSFVEFHKNQSIEKYGIPDSLDFIKTTNCWGYFAESDESNAIYLDTCSGGNSGKKSTEPMEKDIRHTGSTFLLLDVDSDNDKDLLLGDVDYPNLVLLTNGGDVTSACITGFDTLFPSYDKPVNLVSMPLAAYCDVDNDDVNDLILSPFDPALDKSKNKKSSWLYLNEGENNHPQFSFTTDSFLQDEMIDVGSGAYPVFFDYDGDGLQDLFVSNYGEYIYSYYGSGNFLYSVYWSKVAQYRNTGTLDNPKFNRITENFEQLDTFEVRGFFPAFADLDDDSDADMLMGLNDGTLWFFENQSGSPVFMDYGEPVKNYMNIDAGNFSAPQLFDLDDDGLSDLIIGEENGNLNYYQNTGTPAEPAFTFITDSLGKVNVTDYQFSYTGYSVPFFFRENSDQTRLVVGSERGKLFYYKNIDGNLEGIFAENDSLLVLTGGEPKDVKPGIRTSAVLYDLNNDGFPDMIAGNFSGGLNYYSGAEPPGVIGWQENNSLRSVRLFPNPANDVIYMQFEGDVRFTEARITIWNTVSQPVYSGIFSINEVIRIPIQSLSAGIYMCTIQSAATREFSIYKKVVVAR